MPAAIYSVAALLPDELIGGLALYGFVLNTVWEGAQLAYLYDCWHRWGTGRRVLVPLVCVLGDVLLMFAVAALAALLVGSGSLAPPTTAGWAALVAIGFTLGVILEGIAVTLDLWTYTARMPVLRVGALQIGWSPILQIALLPAASVYLAST